MCTNTLWLTVSLSFSQDILCLISFLTHTCNILFHLYSICSTTSTHHKQAAMTRHCPYSRPPANRKVVAGREPLAIISTYGPSVLSAGLVPSGSHLQQMSLLANNPYVRISDIKLVDASEESSKRRGKMRRQRGRRGASSSAKSTDLLVSSIDSGRDAADVRSALVNSPEARCLVEYHSGAGTFITTLRDDGFVWNLSALLDPHSAQFNAVARRSPFMRRFRRQTDSSHADGTSDDVGDLFQVDCVTVHEIRHEDCPSFI